MLKMSELAELKSFIGEMRSDLADTDEVTKRERRYLDDVASAIYVLIIMLEQDILEAHDDEDGT